MVLSDEVAAVAYMWCKFGCDAEGGGVALASAGVYEVVEAVELLAGKGGIVLAIEKSYM